MRITTYRTYLKDDFTNELVKERSCNYPGVNALNSPEAIVKMMNDVFHLNQMAEEYAYMIAVNTKVYPIGIFEISHGTVNMSLISTRDILVKALLCGATSIILIHNHPSLDSSPSGEDKRVTKRIHEACEIVGISLLDHIIIGKEFYSFKINEGI